MSILQQIKSDIQILKLTISGLTMDCKVVENGVLLKGKRLEAALKLAREKNTSELRRLELILESGVIPKKYYSIVTHQNYFPSADELKEMSKPLPKAKHTFFAVKSSRKKNPELKQSEFLVVQDDAKSVLNFFIEHNSKKEYPKGAMAFKIKKGYLKKGDSEPKFAIKIYHQDLFPGNSIQELRLAMRAAYCYKQLGRVGLCFRENAKQYMVTEWLTGVNLDIADQVSVQSMPMAQRIVMAISLFRELNILHKQGLLHRDIKPGNVIIDYGKLGFVDLDSVRSIHYTESDPIAISTEAYLPTAQMKYDLSHNSSDFDKAFTKTTDIYQMGLTLAYLFQDILIPQIKEKTISVTGDSSNFTYKKMVLLYGKDYGKHSALGDFLLKIILQQGDFPDTTEKCIDTLKQILKTYPDYTKYLSQDRLINVGKDITLKDGEKAFKEIEIELQGFNQRLDVVSKLKIH